MISSLHFFRKYDIVSPQQKAVSLPFLNIYLSIQQNQAFRQIINSSKFISEGGFFMVQKNIVCEGLRCYVHSKSAFIDWCMDFPKSPVVC